MDNNMQYRPSMELQTTEERQMAMYLHLSHLAGMIIPFAGIVLPIIIWQTQKEKMPALDAHGKMVLNWTISAMIYVLVCIPLILLFFLGLLGILAVGGCSIAFAIIGAVKANNGELWEYPLTIKFLK